MSKELTNDGSLESTEYENQEASTSTMSEADQEDNASENSISLFSLDADESSAGSSGSGSSEIVLVSSEPDLSYSCASIFILSVIAGLMIFSLLSRRW